MANILITGGAGYIGSVLVPLLLERGDNVTVLDSFLYRQNSLLNCCKFDNFDIINGDCRNRQLLEQTLSGKDIIIPLAAIVGFPACEKDSTAALSTNLEAVKTILELRDKSQKIIFPCTNSGYGIGQGSIFCTEESPIKPISLYGRTKMEAERIVLDAGNSVAFRFATLFGVSPRMRTDLLVNDFVYRAVHDQSIIIFEGNFIRNFLHVRDAANAFIFAIDNFDRMNGNTFNCGLSDSNLSKIELCERIKMYLPGFTFLQASIGEDPDKRNYYVSNSKIENLGFVPRFSLDDGIKELIKAFRMIKNNIYGNV